MVKSKSAFGEKVPTPALLVPEACGEGSGRETVLASGGIGRTSPENPHDSDNGRECAGES